MKKNFFIKTKQKTAILLAVALILQLAACGSTDVKGSFVDEPGHGKWVDSDLLDAVKAEDEIRLQDDFAAAANQEIITSLQMDDDQEYWSIASSTGELIQERYRQILLILGLLCQRKFSRISFR